jgi:hypothetical protein
MIVRLYVGSGNWLAADGILRLIEHRASSSFGICFDQPSMFNYPTKTLDLNSISDNPWKGWGEQLPQGK